MRRRQVADGMKVWMQEGPGGPVDVLVMDTEDPAKTQGLRAPAASAQPLPFGRVHPRRQLRHVGQGGHPVHNRGWHRYCFHDVG